MLLVIWQEGHLPCKELLFQKVKNADIALHGGTIYLVFTVRVWNLMLMPSLLRHFLLYDRKGICPLKNFCLKPPWIVVNVIGWHVSRCTLWAVLPACFRNNAWKVLACSVRTLKMGIIILCMNVKSDVKMSKCKHSSRTRFHTPLTVKVSCVKFSEIANKLEL